MLKLNHADLGLGGGSLLQVANGSHTQMMSYLIDTPDGKVIVIDGGFYCEEDARKLYRLIGQRGKHVDLWIITHAHNDHFGALIWIMEKFPVFDIEIDNMCFHFPDRKWIAQAEPARYKFFELFETQIKAHSIPVNTLYAGDAIECGGVSVEIVSHPVDYKDYPTINSTSLIFLIHFPKRDVLFLGDFDWHAQKEFLAKHDISKIRKDIVQMGHHGQAGPDRSFYELIRPKICLYPTPKWLWENNFCDCDDPASAGKGPYATLETRKWMEDIGVDRSYTNVEGDWLFY